MDESVAREPPKLIASSSPSMARAPEDSPSSNLSLQRWQDERREAIEEMRKLDDRQTRNRNEVYTLFSLYMVFQGVVITAIFSASSYSHHDRCSLWWIPFSLSLLSSLTVIWVIVDRLLDIGQTASAVQYVLDAQERLRHSISGVQLLGVSFDVEKAPNSWNDSIQWDRSVVQMPRAKFGIQWKDCVLTYIWGVLVLACLFSAIVLASCKLVLCAA